VRVRPPPPDKAGGDGDPGVELQVDFGRLGLIPDPAAGVRRVTYALICTAVYSRHMFVYPIHRQTLDEVIAGFEAAWAFFGGVFKVIIRVTSSRSSTGPTPPTRGSTPRFASTPKPRVGHRSRVGAPPTGQTGGDLIPNAGVVRSGT
jgi:hypothetical protein